jgi:hypothetical protein
VLLEAVVIADPAVLIYDELLLDVASAINKWFIPMLVDPVYFDRIRPSKKNWIRIRPKATTISRLRK